MSDTAPLTDDLLIWLSAYVDGALSVEESARVEALAAEDPRVAQELRALVALNEDLRLAMDGLLEQPVPAALTQGLAPSEPVQPKREAANSPAAPRMQWRAMAATLVIGALLGAGGMFAVRSDAPQVEVAAARSWLGEVAEYHQIYARQTRHLVEVPAAEKTHIEKWLGKEIGVAFTVPDLESSGWTFQGARLLVAAGKPVAQLLYTDASGRVIALCALHNGSGTPAGPALRTFGDVHMATWKSATGSFALVGDAPAELEALAAAAAPLI